MGPLRLKPRPQPQTRLMRVAALKFLGVSLVPMIQAWRTLVMQHKKMRRVARSLGFSSQSATKSMLLSAWYELVMSRRLVQEEEEQRARQEQARERAQQKAMRVLQHLGHTTACAALARWREAVMEWRTILSTVERFLAPSPP